MMEQTIQSLLSLKVAFGKEEFNEDKISLILSLLKKNKRTLSLNMIEAWIITRSSAPHVNELFEMSVECPDL